MKLDLKILLHYSFATTVPQCAIHIGRVIVVINLLILCRLSFYAKLSKWGLEWTWEVTLDNNRQQE
jgi:hypothetical protein